MKKLSIVIIIAFSLYFVVSQTVTNSGIDIVTSTNLDSNLRNSWKIDENQRTNGLPPYTSSVPAITYKDFLASAYSNGTPAVDGTLSQQQEGALFQQIRILRTADPNTYRKIYRIAFGLQN